MRVANITNPTEARRRIGAANAAMTKGKPRMSFASFESATAKNPQSKNNNSVIMKLALMDSTLVRTNPASTNETRAFTANKSKMSKNNPITPHTSKN